MSRSGYSEDLDNWSLIRYRGAVQSAIRGKRGQAFLRELIDALDALPQKRLAPDSLQTSDGEFCALGAVGRSRGLDMSTMVDLDIETVAAKFGIADAMAREIVFENDETWYGPAGTPELRFSRVRSWAESSIENTST